MIGVFDSGIGGLTVLRELLRELSECAFTYLGDTARAPYGTKGHETIARYTREDAQLLLDHGCEFLVVACNTASAVATRDLWTAFPRAPIVEVVTPAVDAACAATRNGRIGVIGTRATIASSVYEREIRRRLPTLAVASQACPLLVPLVEEGWLDHPVTETVLREYLEPVRAARVDTLILGCTHYPLLEDMVARVMGDAVTLINPARAVARIVRDRLDRDPIRKTSCRGSARVFLVTDRTPHFERIAQEWLGTPIHLEVVHIP